MDWVIQINEKKEKLQELCSWFELMRYYIMFVLESGSLSLLIASRRMQTTVYNLRRFKLP